MDNDKYKDFEELENTDEYSLEALFNKRNYGKYIDDPLADDIIVSSAHVVTGMEGDIPIVKFLNTFSDEKISTYQERMDLKKMNASAAYKFSKTKDIEVARSELSFLKPVEIENRYLRKRVEAYRDYCSRIINKGMTFRKPLRISMRRVYSFILAEANKRGEDMIKEMSKKDFLLYVKEKKRFDISANSLYQSVRSRYKEDKNYLHYLDKMKMNHPREYNYAMQLFRDFYPELIKE